MKSGEGSFNPILRTDEHPRHEPPVVEGGSIDPLSALVASPAGDV
jgi:hypothetical protein